MVHRFSVNEAVSSLFSVSILARSDSPVVDLEEIVDPGGLVPDYNKKVHIEARA